MRPELIKSKSVLTNQASRSSIGIELAKTKTQKQKSSLKFHRSICLTGSKSGQSLATTGEKRYSILLKSGFLAGGTIFIINIRSCWYCSVSQGVF